jgi:DNA-binding transcriptional ArsR family regulator
VHTQQADVGRVFHALGDATRREMIERLSEGPVSVSQLAKPLGISLAAVIQHLQVLQESALVHTEKQGRTRLCRLEPAGLSVIEHWIGDRRRLWERKLDRLGDLLAEEDLPDVDI